MARTRRGLSMNTATLGFQWPLSQTIAACARAGLGGIAPWRREFAAIAPRDARRQATDAGLAVTCLCRGGYLTHDGAAQRAAVIADNRRAIEEAAELGAPALCIVVGSLPDLAAARRQVADVLGELAPHAAACGVRLAVEPLHPIYAADRSCINTLATALDICDAVGGGVGVMIDTYHLWWDPALAAGLRRAGAARLHGWQIADWRAPLRDMLMDRGMIGDGVIDFAAIEAMVREAGWTGLTEVEIFSDDWGRRDPAETLRVVAERFSALPAPQ